MKTILLIEDDLSINQIMVEILENENFLVQSAKNGKEGLDIINVQKPDLIICDICMPVLSGLDLLKILRSKKETARIPFIFLTAMSSMSALREGMNLGADDYLTKPFRVNDVLKTVRLRLHKNDDILNLVEELKETFIKKIPHELRTPLVAILGFSELIENEIESLSKEELLEMVERISYSGRRLHRRIEKFLVYADLLSTPGNDVNNTATPAEISEEYYKQKFKLLGDELEIKRSIVINMQESLVNIEESHYETIMRELVENAFKFSVDDGRPITVIGETGDEYYRTKIINYGKYLTPEKISRISAFNMFDEERNTTEGNGLGLAIVKKLVELSRGYLSIESTPDLAMVFEFCIPLANKPN